MKLTYKGQFKTLSLQQWRSPERLVLMLLKYSYKGTENFPVAGRHSSFILITFYLSSIIKVVLTV